MALSLCAEVLAGLKRLGNCALINEDLFAKLLNRCLTTLTQSSMELISTSDIMSSKGDIMKEAHAALLVLMVEAARHHTSPQQLDGILNDLSWPVSRKNNLSQLYFPKLSQLQASFSCVGMHPPHIVDVHWQLNFCVKSSISDHAANPLILVQLVTEGKECNEPVKFSCTVSELQDLQAKLKEALRHLDRIGQLSS